MLLSAAPFLVRRFIEPAVAPRAAAWIYFALLVSLFAMVSGLSIFLFLFMAPQGLIGGLGAGCQHGPYCLHGLPPWAQFTLWLSVTGLLGWLTVRTGWSVFAALWAGRRVRDAALSRGVAVGADGGPYPVLEVSDTAVFACTVGTCRPLIVLSQGLRQALPPEELVVVLAHEEAHAAGRDNALLLWARVVDHALFFLPGVSRAHAGLQRCVELAADACASAVSGDELLVATSVSHVARLRFGSTKPRLLGSVVAAAFAHRELVVERVQHLVKGQAGTSRRRLLLGIAALALVLTVFGTSFYAVTGNSLTGDPQSTACTETAWK